MPYRWVGSNKYYQYPLPALKAGGAGGWISTANDFYHFALALMNGKLLSSSSLDLMITGHSDMPPRKYGYGMEVYKDLMVQGKTVYGHNGGGMGFACDLYFEPESKTVVVTMLNQYGNSRPITRNFMKIAFGETPDPIIDKGVQLYDQISANGMDNFAKNYLSYFENIGIDPSNSFFLISFADGYEMLGENENFLNYLKVLQNVAPNDPVLYIRLYDASVALNNKEWAKEYIERARDLAIKHDPYWLKEIEHKILKLEMP